MSSLRRLQAMQPLDLNLRDVWLQSDSSHLPKQRVIMGLRPIACMRLRLGINIA